MNLTNKLNLPDPIVDAIKSFERVPYALPGAQTISVTELIGPPQIRLLGQRYSNVLEEDASDRIWSLIGSAVHEILARADRRNQAERQLSKLLHHRGEDFVLTGTSDRIALVNEGYYIQDYKVASVWEVIYGVKPERVAQLNLYRYLLMEEDDQDQGTYPTNLQVVYLLRDWKKSEAKLKPANEYPQSQVAVINIPVWSYFETHNYILDQIDRHFFNINSMCSFDERWARPTMYALMKSGNKKAIRVLPNRDELVAYAHAKGHVGPSYYIQDRPGRNVRCEDYCPVATVCPQWAALKEVASEPDSSEG